MSIIAKAKRREIGNVVDVRCDGVHACDVNIKYGVFTDAELVRIMVAVGRTLCTQRRIPRPHVVKALEKGLAERQGPIVYGA